MLPGGRLDVPARARLDLASVEVPTDADVFMCGPLPFMRDARAELIRRGLPTTRIRYEVFGSDMFAGSSLGQETPAP